MSEPVRQPGGLGAILLVSLVLEVAAAVRCAKARIAECRARWCGRVV